MPHRLKPIAQRLRRMATSAEKRIWRWISNRQIEGFRFRRQVIIGDHVVDFACYEARLVVEIDGATHSTDDELRHDARREQAIRSQGYDVLRFQNQDVYENAEGVVETIRLRLHKLRPRIESEIARPPTLSLPRKGGGDANDQRS